MSTPRAELVPTDIMLAFTIASRVPCKRVALAINAVRKTFAGDERNRKVSADSIRDAVLGTTYAAIAQARAGDLLPGEVLRSNIARTGFTIEVSRHNNETEGEQFHVEFRFGHAWATSAEIGTESDFSNVL